MENIRNATENRYPVIIFFHGSGFLLGSGNDYGPSYLLQEDVIFVTVNYRLGVLGRYTQTTQNIIFLLR